MEWNRELRDRPCIYENLIYDESGTRNQWKRMECLADGIGETNSLYGEKENWDPT